MGIKFAAVYAQRQFIIGLRQSRVGRQLGDVAIADYLDLTEFNRRESATVREGNSMRAVKRVKSRKQVVRHLARTAAYALVSKPDLLDDPQRFYAEWHRQFARAWRFCIVYPCKPKQRLADERMAIEGEPDGRSRVQPTRRAI